MRAHKLLTSAGNIRAGAFGALTTPSTLLQTVYGQPLHMMRELLSLLPTDSLAAAAVRYPQIWDQDKVMERTGRSASDYLNLQGRSVFVTLRDPSRFPAPLANDKSVSVDTWGGRRRVTPAEYADSLVRMRCDVAVSLCDEVGPGAGNNRTRAGVDRSLRWLNECAEALLARVTGKSASEASDDSAGPVEPAAKAARRGAAASVHSPVAGAAPAVVAPLPPSQLPRLLAFIPVLSDPGARAKAVNEVVARVEAINTRAARVFAENAQATANSGSGSSEQPPLVVGYVLGCLGLGESPADRLAAVRDVTSRLPPQGLRLLPGVGSPLEALDLIEAGVDLFDSDYSMLLTQFGHAAAFRYDPEAAEPPAAAAAPQGSDGVGTSAGAPAAPVSGPAEPRPYAFQRNRSGSRDFDDPAAAAHRFAQALGAPAPATAGSTDGSGSPSLGDGTKLTLRDKRYARDTRPLVPECACFACAGAPPSAFEGYPSGRAAGNEPSSRPVAHGGHSRAYVHHLLNAHEMLGDVLLSAHNTAHHAGFMAAARRAALGGTEAFSAYRRWFVAANGLQPGGL